MRAGSEVMQGFANGRKHWRQLLNGNVAGPRDRRSDQFWPGIPGPARSEMGFRCNRSNRFFTERRLAVAAAIT